MLKLKGFLKPFIFGLLLAIVLLFGQAVCDLNLPNFMSDIVNVGLQQGGIDHAAPSEMSENAYKLMTSVMTNEEKTLTEKSYQLENGRYIRNKINEAELSDLDNAFGAATWTLINLMRDMAAQNGSQAEMTSLSAKDINLENIYKFLPMLDKIPSETLNAAHEKALENDGTILKQSGIVLTKAFYAELGMDTNKIQTNYILRVGGYMLGIAFLGGAATVLVSFLSSRIGAGVARNLRNAVFTKVESFSNDEFDKFSTASLITRCTNDITNIQMLISIGIRMLCYAPIMGIGGIIMAVGKSPSMSWIIAVACIVLLGIIAIVMAVALPKFKLVQKLIDKLNLVSREELTGLMVIRAFGTQKYEKERFDAANKDLTKTNLFVNRVMTFMMPCMMLIMNGVTLLIIWVGAHQIAVSSMQVGDMMAFMQYAIQIISSFLMISMMFIFVPRAAVSADRISEVLEIPLSINDPELPKSFDENKKGYIEFKDVCFRYHDAEDNAVSEISFTAKPGETTAIIGSTGSGKSTVASLLMRFYDVTCGQILVGGTDIRNVRQADLRQKIGYVPQKGVLFSGTIESNLRYGKKDADDDELRKAAEVAQALDFINEKPDGLDSDIAQGGANVSGGQKQRLSIARALAKNPEILIFDDSFSALDFKTDAALRKALKEHTSQSTILVIAQRVNTIMNAEQIIVMEKGKITGIGTHRELLKSCPEYYEIAMSQLSKEELA